MKIKKTIFAFGLVVSGVLAVGCAVDPQEANEQNEPKDEETIGQVTQAMPIAETSRCSRCMSRAWSSAQSCLRGCPRNTRDPEQHEAWRRCFASCENNYLSGRTICELTDCVPETAP